METIIGRRKKTLLKESISIEEADKILGEYAEANSQFKKKTAKMELKIIEVRNEFTAELDKWQAVMDAKFELLQHYAETNPEQFKDRKSLELTHGIIGFRTGTPKLKLAKGFKWENVLANLKNLLPEFVRIKEEVDKDSLLSNATEPTVNAKFHKVGVYVDQDETFYVKPKEELN